MTGKVVARFAGRQHTAARAPVFAYGPGSELFTELYQNTNLYFCLK